MLDKYFFNSKNVMPQEPEPEVFEDSSGEEVVKIIPNRSPRWQKSTKTLIIAALIILSLAVIIFLRNLISPILIAVIMTYLLQPINRFFNLKLNISWKASVIILYFLLILLLGGLVAWGGISLFSQAENLFNFMNQILKDISSQSGSAVALMESPSPIIQVIHRFSSSEAGLEIFSALQNIMSGVTKDIGVILSGFASKIVWFFFSLGLSFFLLFESNGSLGKTIGFNLEGYEYDFYKAKQQLTRIWNSFLRGQILLMLFTILLYFLVFVILGLNYSMALAFLMGLARLVPYVGSTIAYIFFAIVAFYQPNTILGLPPLNYVVVIVLIAFIIDKLMDSILTPKVMANTLKIHPAAVLVAAIVFSKFLGVIGIFLAAPITASFKLLFTYIYRKLTDQDPWKGIATMAKPVPLKLLMKNTLESLKKFLGELVVFTVNFSKWLAQKIKIWIEYASRGYQNFRQKRKRKKDHEQSGDKTGNHNPD